MEVRATVSADEFARFCRRGRDDQAGVIGILNEHQEEGVGASLENNH